MADFDLEFGPENRQVDYTDDSNSDTDYEDVNTPLPPPPSEPVPVLGSASASVAVAVADAHLAHVEAARAQFELATRPSEAGEVLKLALATTVASAPASASASYIVTGDDGNLHMPLVNNIMKRIVDVLEKNGGTANPEAAKEALRQLNDLQTAMKATKPVYTLDVPVNVTDAGNTVVFTFKNTVAGKLNGNGNGNGKANGKAKPKSKPKPSSSPLKITKHAATDIMTGNGAAKHAAAAKYMSADGVKRVLNVGVDSDSDETVRIAATAHVDDSSCIHVCATTPCQFAFMAVTHDGQVKAEDQVKITVRELEREPEHEHDTTTTTMTLTLDALWLAAHWIASVWPALANPEMDAPTLCVNGDADVGAALVAQARTNIDVLNNSYNNNCLIIGQRITKCTAALALASASASASASAPVSVPVSVSATPVEKKRATTTTKKLASAVPVAAVAVPVAVAKSSKKRERERERDVVFQLPSAFRDREHMNSVKDELWRAVTESMLLSGGGGGGTLAVVNVYNDDKNDEDDDHDVPVPSPSLSLAKRSRV